MYRSYQYINRRKSKPIKVGQVKIGDGAPISVQTMTNTLTKDIKSTIKNTCSPRHVPQKILTIKDIPYTINGKKVELAVKHIIQDIEVKNQDSLANPEVLDYYKEIEELNT